MPHRHGTASIFPAYSIILQPLVGEPSGKELPDFYLSSDNQLVHIATTLSLAGVSVLDDASTAFIHPILMIGWSSAIDHRMKRTPGHYSTANVHLAQAVRPADRVAGNDILPRSGHRSHRKCGESPDRHNFIVCCNLRLPIARIAWLRASMFTGFMAESQSAELVYGVKSERSTKISR